jgi:hypothetical protein
MRWLKSKPTIISGLTNSLYKKYSFKLAFFLVFTIGLFPLAAQAKYGGGSGEPNDPYLIYTAEQMNTIGTEPNDWNKHFKLMADIDLAQYTGQEFNLIGSLEQPFHGVFDGNGHEIANFSYSCPGMTFVGLFRYVDGNNTCIRDLGLKDPNIVLGSSRSPYVLDSLRGFPPADWLFFSLVRWWAALKEVLLLVAMLTGERSQDLILSVGLWGPLVILQ